MRRLILLLLLRTPAAEPQTCPEIEMEQPQACLQSVEMTKPVRVLVAVRSTRRERRDAIRDTWCQAAARAAAWSNVSIAVRFWVGGGSLMEDARYGAESELFRDMAHTTHIALNDDEALARAPARVRRRDRAGGLVDGDGIAELRDGGAAHARAVRGRRRHAVARVPGFIKMSARRSRDAAAGLFHEVGLNLRARRSVARI